MQKEKDFQDFLQRLIEPDEQRRAQLLQEIEQRDEAGADPALDDAGRFQFRSWLIDFARREPFIVAIAPLSLLCWLLLAGSWIVDGFHAVVLRFFGG